jgi:hypothetical protein
MHSINVVDTIAEWKGQLATEAMLRNRLEFSAPFVFKNENYLAKMHMDCLWIASSNLARFLRFTDRIDPFLSGVR